MEPLIVRFSIKINSNYKFNFQEPNQTLSLDKAISKMTNVDNMLEVMYEMIQTYVQTCSLVPENTTKP